MSSKFAPDSEIENTEAGHPRTVTLTATGRAREEWPRFLGDYSLTQREHNGRPVYSNKCNNFY